jgi:hypothetical protein
MINFGPASVLHVQSESLDSLGLLTRGTILIVRPRGFHRAAE